MLRGVKSGLTGKPKPLRGLDAAAQQHSSTANGDLRLLSAYVIRAKHKANAFPMQFGRSTPRACARPPPGRTMEEQQL